ncbi:MAG: hypothetical protein ACREMB_13280 [Candidatus Rokuibacteriota bacterium]
MRAPAFHLLASAARPVAPSSHAIEVDGWVFVTDELPNDPDAPDAPLNPRHNRF